MSKIAVFSDKSWFGEAIWISFRIPTQIIQIIPYPLFYLGAPWIWLFTNFFFSNRFFYQYSKHSRFSLKNFSPGEPISSSEEGFIPLIAKILKLSNSIYDASISCLPSCSYVIPAWPHKSTNGLSLVSVPVLNPMVSSFLCFRFFNST